MQLNQFKEEDFYTIKEGFKKNRFSPENFNILLKVWIFFGIWVSIFYVNYLFLGYEDLLYFIITIVSIISIPISLLFSFFS
ncbi:hypothetical protein ACWOFR_08635 [Carnobacterium gallinarum]|uniref:hypothetical protein n=1 Tax=Carnobacterium gallinarum TaxID=2749 RepID=UPI000557E62B|nr:hypothetical protein [Carnobacterium gallinarum]